MHLIFQYVSGIGKGPPSLVRRSFLLAFCILDRYVWFFFFENLLRRISVCFHYCAAVRRRLFNDANRICKWKRENFEPSQWAFWALNIISAMCKKKSAIRAKCFSFSEVPFYFTTSIFCRDSASQGKPYFFVFYFNANRMLKIFNYFYAIYFLQHNLLAIKFIGSKMKNRLNQNIYTIPKNYSLYCIRFLPTKSMFNLFESRTPWIFRSIGLSSYRISIQNKSYPNRPTARTP